MNSLTIRSLCLFSINRHEPHLSGAVRTELHTQIPRKYLQPIYGGPRMLHPPYPRFAVLLSFNCRRTLSQYLWRVQCKPCVCSALGVDRTHGCAEEGRLRTTALSKPKNITKAQVQRRISQLALKLAEKALEMVASSPSSKALLHRLQIVRITSKDLLKLNQSFFCTRSSFY